MKMMQSMPGSELERALSGSEPVRGAAELSIELLERLASSGQIDPWDVDVVAAMDQCLANLNVTDRQDLRRCGRTLLCATILLRLKAEAMAAAMEDILAPAAVDLDDWVDLADPDATEGIEDRVPGVVLDLALVRRANARLPRRRRVTLAELIAELREVEEASRAGPGNPNPIRRASLAELRARTVGLAHEEDVEGDARRLAEELQRRFQFEPAIAFSAGLSPGLDDRGCFLALMFLAHWGVLELEQERPYGDLVVRPVPVGASESPGAQIDGSPASSAAA